MDFIKNMTLSHEYYLHTVIDNPHDIMQDILYHIKATDSSL